jgi:hypothetical protein
MRTAAPIADPATILLSVGQRRSAMVEKRHILRREKLACGLPVTM